MKILAFISMSVALFTAAPATAMGVSLESFGLQDVERVANCVANRVPSFLASDLTVTYWQHPIRDGSQCASSSSRVDAATRARARSAFLTEYSFCTGVRNPSDGTPMVQRVAYATAIIAAHGVYDAITGERLVDNYIRRTQECRR